MKGGKIGVTNRTNTEINQVTFVNKKIEGRDIFLFLKIDLSRSERDLFRRILRI